MQLFAEGVWLDTAPARIVGMKLTSTMTVLRLDDGDVLLHSPIAMTPERRAAVDAIGRVAHLYAPNTYHHMSIGDWSAAYPDARVHAPSKLVKKRPDLRIDRAHDAAPHALAGALEIHVAGFRLQESVLLHARSGTLVVADLVHNIGRPDQTWARIYSRAMGFYDRVAISKMIRCAGFSDRAA